jgi:hypothetical protein
MDHGGFSVCDIIEFPLAHPENAFVARRPQVTLAVFEQDISVEIEKTLLRRDQAELSILVASDPVTGYPEPNGAVLVFVERLNPVAFKAIFRGNSTGLSILEPIQIPNGGDPKHSSAVFPDILNEIRPVGGAVDPEKRNEIVSLCREDAIE